MNQVRTLGHGPHVSRSRSPVSTALWAWTWVLVVALYLPLLVIAIYSFNRDRFLLLWGGLGVSGYLDALANGAVRDAFATSILVAVGTAGASTILGGLAGVALAHGEGRWKAPFSAVIAFVLVAPEIVAGIAYLMAFVSAGVSSGVIRLMISHTVFATAVVTLVVRARAESLDPRLEEAAADLGAPPARVFADVTLPLLRPALLAGACLAFTFSLDDVVISAFVSTPGSVTLPVYIFSALRTGLKTEHAAASMMALALTVLVACLAWGVAGGELYRAVRRSSPARRLAPESATHPTRTGH